MFQTLILISLVVEGVVLSLLMLPLPASVAGPVSQVMKKLNIYALGFFCLVIAAGTIGAYFRMSEIDSRPVPTDHLSRQAHMVQRFRSQRDFYMDLIAFAFLILIFRARQLVSTIAKLKTRISELESTKKTE
eukprot:TRINITY_DN3838_c0_g1_i1.p1 TRINITY_DN3838_c0_g1~~TRINITY_DN3838_c0_g1_i1.p1  ORF type:complete len:139 (-),score=40.25 TRINITY_DN3838_c0_g1_i1:46-441(-)